MHDSTVIWLILMALDALNFSGASPLQRVVLELSQFQLLMALLLLNTRSDRSTLLTLTCVICALITATAAQSFVKLQRLEESNAIAQRALYRSTFVGLCVSVLIPLTAKWVAPQRDVLFVPVQFWSQFAAEQQPNPSAVIAFA